MNKGLIIAIVLSVVGIGIASFFFLDKGKDANTNEIDQVNETNSASDMPIEADTPQDDVIIVENPQDEDEIERTNENPGTYTVYSPETLDQYSDKRRVLYFYANWCPTCRKADPDIKANISELPSDVAVIRVNYNDTDTDQLEEDLAEKYEITYQHTFVQIDADGEVVTRWNGGEFDELIENIK